MANYTKIAESSSTDVGYLATIKLEIPEGTLYITVQRASPALNMPGTMSQSFIPKMQAPA